jgi:uncharacterized protein YraI
MELKKVKVRPMESESEEIILEDIENEDTEHERREVRVNAGIYKLLCISMGLCLIAGSVVWATLLLRDRIDTKPTAAGTAASGSGEASIPEEAAATTTTTTAPTTTTVTTTTTADPYTQAVAPQFEDDYGTMYVSSDSLAMRIGPGYDYTKVEGDGIPSGTQLSILAEQEDSKSDETWCYAEYNGESGWVCKTYLSSTNPTVTVVQPDQYYLTSSNITVTRYGGLKLYAGPDESYDVLAEIPEGETLQKIGYNYMSVKWVYTCYGEQNGWIVSYDGDWFNPSFE